MTNPTLKAQFEAILKEYGESETPMQIALTHTLQRAYDIRQAKIDQLSAHITKLEATVWEQAEINTEQSGLIDALQSKITKFAGIIMDYETKFDVIAENEGKRCIEFGEYIKGKCLLEAWGLETPNTTRINIESINIKQLYTNFKRK